LATSLPRYTEIFFSLIRFLFNIILMTSGNNISPREF
jgi:hypothetical protein